MATKKEQIKEIKGNLGEISPKLEEVPVKSWAFPEGYVPIDIDSEINWESMEEM